MKGSTTLARYEIAESYDWNYANAPQPIEIDAPACSGSWDFCGLPIDSPLGVPAGPLLNSGWILYYASLGFSVLTYKTVRSSYRACYGPPNLLPVRAAPLIDSRGRVTIAPAGAVIDSWAISFGMPSKDPSVWSEDVTRARRGLRPGQALVVSVVASPKDGWTLDEMSADFVRCARWAVDAGAQAVEANLSCPNVCSQEGQLYTSPEASAQISSEIRNAIGRTPLILKIGLFDGRSQAEAFVAAVDGHATALSTVNSITATVAGSGGEPLFGGLMRGIGGLSIRDRSNAEIAMLRDTIGASGSGLRLIGVGGVSTAADVRARLAAGAHHVQMATAAMLDPEVGMRIRRELAAADT
jgi:dihydroorotate dehydrogenase (NAD+) catalytic subunit